MLKTNHTILQNNANNDKNKLIITIRYLGIFHFISLGHYKYGLLLHLKRLEVLVALQSFSNECPIRSLSVSKTGLTAFYLCIAIINYILLLLHVPYLSTLNDTVALHLPLSIAILVARPYGIPVHSLMSSYQLILGQPLFLFPSIHPSNSVLYMLFSRIKCPKYLNSIAVKKLLF